MKYTIIIEDTDTEDESFTVDAVTDPLEETGRKTPASIAGFSVLQFLLSEYDLEEEDQNELLPEAS